MRLRSHLLDFLCSPSLQPFVPEAVLDSAGCSAHWWDSEQQEQEQKSPKRQWLPDVSTQAE